MLLRCVTGASKTHLSLSLRDTTKYHDLREEILRWDRAHQKWTNLVSATDDAGTEVKPMEVDRIQALTREKEKETKAVQKESQSRKARTRVKPSPMTKVAITLKRENQLRHRAKERVARLTRLATFAVNLDILRRLLECCSKCSSQFLQYGFKPIGKAQQHQAQQSTQYKVSRISEAISIVEGSEHFVCDLRDSSKSSAGSIRAIHFFIGDSDEVGSVAHDGEIRAIISELPDNAGDMCNSEIDAEWFENNWNWLQYREDAFYVHVKVFRQLGEEEECFWNRNSFAMRFSGLQMNLEMILVWTTF